MFDFQCQISQLQQKIKVLKQDLKKAVEIIDFQKEQMSTMTATKLDLIPEGQSLVSSGQPEPQPVAHP